MAEAIARVRIQLEEAFGRVLGSRDIARWMLLLGYFFEVAITYGASFLTNLGNALKSGRLLDLVNYLIPVIATSIREGRTEARESGVLALPVSIIRMVPAQFQSRLGEVGYTTLDLIDDKRFAAVWSHFKGHTAAVTLIDTIVFVKPPNWQSADDIFMCLHEIKHVFQYQDLGVDIFVADYMNDKVNGIDPVRLEIDADQFACAIFPHGHPVYISGCTPPSAP